MLAANWETAEKVSPETAAQRMKICKDCPKLNKVLGLDICSVCGCNMAIKTKLLYDTVEFDPEDLEKIKCPLGLW